MRCFFSFNVCDRVAQSPCDCRFEKRQAVDEDDDDDDGGDEDGNDPDAMEL